MHNQQTVLSDDMYPTNRFYFYNSGFTSGSIQLTLSTKIQSINIIYMFEWIAIQWLSMNEYHIGGVMSNV
jgi:hypothetical protein